MAVSAHDVAAELRRRFSYDPGVTRIHKLLYYAQGWHLVWFDRPLFSECIEAWTQGPVVAHLWHDEKRHRARPPSQALDGDGLAVLDYVMGRYGGISGRELIRRTHNEDPWRLVSERDDAWTVINPEITHESLCAWFAADDDYLAHTEEVARLRRSAGYSFGPLEMTEDLEDAVARALKGERRHPSQLA